MGRRTYDVCGCGQRRSPTTLVASCRAAFGRRKKIWEEEHVMYAGAVSEDPRQL